MKPVRHLLLLCLAFFCIASCYDTLTQKTLEDVESYIQERPDSALHVLESIDTTFFKTQSAAARYSLLQAMALDKNYIDTSDIKVILPASRYYPHTFDGKRKFLTWYYQGRIYENAGDYDNAMESLVRAEKYAKHTSEVYITRLFAAQERIYIDLLSFSQALDAVNKMLVHAEKSGDIYNYGVALLDKAALYISMKKYPEADSTIKKYEKTHSPGYKGLQGRYWKNKLLYSLACKEKKDSIPVFISNHLASGQDIDLTACAGALLEIKDYDNAAGFINAYELSAGTPTIAYYDYKYQIALANGDNVQASDYAARYVEALESAASYSLEHETRFISERYQRDLEKTRKGILLYLTGLMLLGIAVFSAIMIHNKNRRYETIKYEFQKIKEEAEINQKVFVSLKDIHPDGAAKSKDAAARRLCSIGSLISGEPSLSIKSSLHKLSALSPNGNSLTESLSFLFALYAPTFYRRMIKQGLSTSEVGYCGLYILGFNTKELVDLLHKKDLYHLNSAIRSKLDMGPHETNLPIRLIQIFEESFNNPDF